MKNSEPADPLLDEVEEAQRRLEAEFDNDPAKLLAHYQEEQRRHAHRMVTRPVRDRALPSPPGQDKSAA